MNTAIQLSNTDIADIYSQEEMAVILQARAIIETKFKERGTEFTSPDIVRDYINTHVAGLEREVFGVLYCDNQNRMITNEFLSAGTIDCASVYPRELIKRVVTLGANSIIVYHNHPSGTVQPSQADRKITDRIKNALEMIDVRLLDHFVVGGGDIYSFAQHGIL